MTALVIFLTIFNIIAWIILIIKFRKIFSTEQIISSARNEMDQMIKDIDKTTDRNLYLARESQNQIKAMLDEADRKMELFKEATDRLRNMIGEADKINKAAPKSHVNYTDYSENYSDLSTLKIKDEINVMPDGAAYKEVPLIITKVYDDKPVSEEKKSFTGNNQVYTKPTPAQNTSPVNQRTHLQEKKNINEKVQKLHLEGYSVDEIAVQLSCSITEVQFIIDMM